MSPCCLLACAPQQERFSSEQPGGPQSGSGGLPGPKVAAALWEELARAASHGTEAVLGVSTARRGSGG